MRNLRKRSAVLTRRKRTAAICLFFLILDNFSRLPERKIWMHHWVARREMLGVHKNLYREFRLEDTKKYRRCLRMSPELFDFLLQKVTPIIQKQDTHLRKSISAAERLSITLRHLATGESQESLSSQFRIGQSTVSGIIKETCKAIYTVLKDDFLRFPSNAEEWKAVAQGFEEKWQYPHCLGALDGKHCIIQPPLQSGSLFYNYKETFSVVLMALVDADLRFIFVDVGTNGKVSDRGIWNDWALKTYLERTEIPPSPVTGTNTRFPYIIVGDEGFTLSEKLMIPYPKNLLRGSKDRRIFNYRLSRARRCSENAFGRIANRFQILRAPMRYDPDAATNIVLAICCLHNWLRTDVVGSALYTSPDSVDREDVYNGILRLGQWRRQGPGTGLVPLAQGGNRHPSGALALRDRWCEYFNGVGSVDWKERMVTAPPPVQ